LPAEDRALLDERVRVLGEDPRLGLRRRVAAFDLVVVALPEPTSAAINRFYTEELFAAARAALRPRGVLALGLTTESDLLQPQALMLLRSIQAATERIFPHRALSVGTVQRLFASATPGTLALEPGEVRRRLSRFPGAAPFVAEIAASYERARRRALERGLAEVSETPANTDDRPVAYALGTALWSARESANRGGEDGARSSEPALPGSCLLAGVGLLGVLWLASRRLVRERAAVIDAGVTVLVAGFAAMGLEVSWLLRYQAHAGALYRMLAVMVALFMAGLALGAAICGRVTHRWRRRREALAALLVGFALVALALPQLAAAAGALPAPLALAVFGVGFVGIGLFLGAVFPLVAGLALGEDGGPVAAARAAAVIDAMDHLGGMLGAVVVAAVMAPALGLSASNGVLALLCAVAAAALLAGGCGRGRGVG
jgi:spermidine synthase